jgi:hypothetical protein
MPRESPGIRPLSFTRKSHIDIRAFFVETGSVASGATAM